ncbi:hypothetical protein FSP39_000013 [Pinctada imbricata]|uniref:Uncharacterized protein n=1 Tax=Pinctada imbricata TaxID=66713 RepID=A0AA88XUU4_PINIB|nr:hypothetical protein FSP39_000013 [Pinctada imbricata]
MSSDSEEDNIVLSKLKERIKDTDNEEDIPLKQLAKLSSNQAISDDHGNYFRVVDESQEGSVDLVENDFTLDENVDDGDSQGNSEGFSLISEGIFDLNDTFIIPNDFETSSEQLEILFPLFKDVMENGNVALVSEEVSISEETELNISVEQPSCSVDKNNNTDTDITEDTESQTDSETEYLSKRQSRRRHKNPEQWKQNMRKRKRNQGEEYESCRGKKIPRRSFRTPKCKCKFKCSEKITRDDQEQVFLEYWKRGYKGQREFISRSVTKTNKAKHTRENSRRKYSYSYFLPKDSENIRVCKMFFLKTLDIGEKTVSYTLNKDNDNKAHDRRGHKLGQATKITKDQRQFVRDHINSFPTVESHYCRKTSSRKYLAKDLSIRKMFNLYLEKCEQEEKDPVKYWTYDQIFGNEFNLGFHRPKKDICTFCDSYSKLSEEEKDTKKDQHSQHLQRKEQARNQKKLDKERSMKAEEKIKVINFDLQKVLITPKLFVSDAYYSRKLSTYNLSVFDLASKEVKCYLWNESEAKRGSCEIATCLYKYMKDAGELNEMILYSDSCTGQQRNLPFSIMCLYCVMHYPINKITHNYFERGHSQMEGDSVHATIENYTKKLEIYSPDDWKTAIESSKQKSPKYDVIEVKNSCIIDFKECASSVVSNRRKDITGDCVQWNKVHSFQYRKEDPENIYFKYQYSDEYRVMNIKSRRRVVSLQNYELKTLYQTKVPISASKYADLMSLCNKGLIPSKCHKFYKDLPHDGRGDNLPEPNSSDESDDCD